jgi:hypothetical protein
MYSRTSNVSSLSCNSVSMKLFVSCYELALVTGVICNRWHKGQSDVIEGQLMCNGNHTGNLDGPAEKFLLRFGLTEQNNLCHRNSQPIDRSVR